MTKANPLMSQESSRSRGNIIDRAAVGLEDALARMLGSMRADCDRAVGAVDAERRAIVASALIAQEQLRNSQAEYARLIEEFKKQKVEARGEKGDRGDDGAPGPPGPPGAAGADGATGRDGRDGLPGVPGDRGRDGANGKDGKDGLGVADLDITYDGGRRETYRWSNGDRMIEKTFVRAWPLYCGTWESGKAYEAHDIVTYGGELYIAKCDTNNRPRTDDWQLCSKRGADGKDGKPGDRGPAGPTGMNGRDLTQLGTDGRKW
jgi:Collagen triple helix repeat (20 copies)